MKTKLKSFVCAALVAAVTTTSMTGCKSGCPFSSKKVLTYENKDFYKDGKFDAAKAKQAYYALMKRFNYPIYPALKTDQFWAVDFSLGDFVNVGMGGVFWANFNHKGGGYLGHDIFLLPGQMIVEHSHSKVPGICPPKRESWLIRNGSVYSFSVKDKPTGFPEGVKIPESQKGFTTVNSCRLVKAGEVDTMNGDCKKHFIMAGPEGAIVTEFATFHSNDGLRFTNPKVKF